MTVVIAEDDADIRELVQMLLEDRGVDVLAFGDGHSALESCRREPPALVLLDITMPGISGLEVCRELRALRGMTGVPIVLMTARAREEDIAEGLAAGASDYVVKPFSPTALGDRITELLSQL